MEPELGLGIVTQVDHRTVEIRFPAGECIRRYAKASAPLKRVEFRAGDVIKSRAGKSLNVISTSIIDGVIIYHGNAGDCPEGDLSDHLSFTTPQTRLLSGSLDHNRDFDLRYRTLVFQHNSRKSNVRGFLGGRIDLIPHQLYVAHETASRPAPRVLLSDETGLGKTIEACLVLHRLLISGRINRALILLPASLVHQWFIELFRRFNLFFRIVDSTYCAAVTEKDPKVNPFLEDQLAVCSIDFLASQEKWQEQALAAGWDVVVIDEAHHLTEESPAYALAQKLSLVCGGLLLLTATPEQLGHRHHFARLRLLDAARYHDFQLYEQEETQYLKITALADKIIGGGKLTAADKVMLAANLPEAIYKAGDLNDVDQETRRQIVQDLLDRHGTGRAVFRNTRVTMSGFPQRVAHLLPLLAVENDPQRLTSGTDEPDSRNPVRAIDYSHDPRLLWLARFLLENKPEKVLLICSSTDKVRAIEEALRRHIQVETALFHENQTLLQRDRYAAWFAEEDGAQILLCSEIGSEGRNFQFAHHLVLFDLPLDPELLEQRIGRLDRIGQSETIHIHVPFLTGSGDEILARWYHEGLDAFEQHVPGLYQIYQAVGDQMRQCVSGRQFSLLDDMIAVTRKICVDTGRRLTKGRDRLLQMNSFQPQVAASLIAEIQAVEAKPSLEKYMLDIFEHYGIQSQLISDRTYHLNLLALTTTDFPLPPLKEEEFVATFDRKTASAREDVEFLTWDHPMVLGAMEMILGSEKGNCALAVWPDEHTDEILLEAVFVLECPAPKNLFADRFLPPRPVRVVVNHLLEDRSEACPVNETARRLQIAYETSILDHPRFKQELFPRMLDKCAEAAEKNVAEIVSNGLAMKTSAFLREVLRLKELKKVNKNIRDEEIQSLEKEGELLDQAIRSARLRLDALRLIQRGDALNPEKIAL
jgi:ATP-dependent helicase HepA